ncbi:hypothetical protein [Planktothrix agardhii]|uniref:hypothetical protein n=1 Tax=Planktothrix agardhii TaxID=1160 RepID=UPI001B9EAE06|nr:hypothetical protein [Planktothrix agardhii]CAD0225347.1 hypothetical protein PL10110_240039 [Planktothrix agardhii]
MYVHVSRTSIVRRLREFVKGSSYLVGNFFNQISFELGEDRMGNAVVKSAIACIDVYQK